MKKILRIFLTGLTALLPLTLTIWILYLIFMFIDGITAELIKALFGEKIVGLGFVTTILFIFLVGVITNNIIGKKLLEITDNLAKKIPVVKSVYKVIQEASNTLLNGNKKSFQQAVLVQFPGKEIKSVGFITNNNIMINGEKRIFVFIPTTPNITTGFLINVPENEVEYLDINVNETMKLIVSLGVVGPPEINTKTNCCIVTDLNQKGGIY
ncbi:MAG: DUF502 domain-containing protein [Desulfotomaculum sp.]|nr:DUF502 domain-containing protein [Desulfotomaculum sp.]